MRARVIQTDAVSGIAVLAGPGQTENLKDAVLDRIWLRVLQPVGCQSDRFVVLGALWFWRVNLQRAHRGGSDFKITGLKWRTMGKDQPSALRRLLALQEVGHRVGGSVGGILFGGQTQQHITDTVGISGNADALADALTPAVEICSNCLPLLSCNRFIN